MNRKSLDYYLNLNYTIKVDKLSEDDGGGYEAYIEEFGRITSSSWGKTEREAIKELLLWKNDLIKDWYSSGYHISEPYSKRKDIQAIKDATNVQCQDGTWNYSPYMQGLANGMICALSILEDREPEYLDDPDEWLEDAKDKETIISGQGNIEQKKNESRTSYFGRKAAKSLKLKDNTCVIKEIIPDDIPEWLQTAFKDGKFFKAAIERVHQLQELAIWMTGCGYDFCQHDYFIEQRDKLLKDYHTK